MSMVSGVSVPFFAIKASDFAKATTGQDGGQAGVRKIQRTEHRKQMTEDKVTCFYDRKLQGSNA